MTTAYITLDFEIEGLLFCVKNPDYEPVERETNSPAQVDWESLYLESDTCAYDLTELLDPRIIDLVRSKVLSHFQQ